MLPYSRQPMPELDEKRFSLFEFGGGLNNAENDVIIADNECSDNLNMRFLSNKLMESRYGTSLIDDFVCGTGSGETFVAEPILWLDEYKSNGNTNKWIKCTSTAMYVNNVKVATLSGGLISGVNYLNKYYLVDGTQTIIYDGTNALTLYCRCGSKMASASIIGATTLTVEYTDHLAAGDYIQVETTGYYEGRIIASVNHTTKVITVTEAFAYIHFVGDMVRFFLPNPKADILGTFASNTSTGATSVILTAIDYRVQVGWQFSTQDPTGGGDLHTITALNRTTKTLTFTPAFDFVHASGTTMKLHVPGFTSYYYGQTKQDLTAMTTWYEPCDYELEADYLGENTVPKNPSVILEHNDRIFISGSSVAPHEIYMSDISNQLYYPVLSGLQIPPTSDAIISMSVFDKALVVARNRDMYVIRGNSPDPSSNNAFSIEKMDTHTGMVNRQSSAILNNFLFFLGYDKKFYKCNSPSTYVEYLMTTPLTKKVDISLEPLFVTTADLSKTSATVFNNQYILMLGNIIMVYNFDNKAFTYFTGIGASCVYCNGVDMYFGKSNGTVVLYDKTIYNDVGVAYESRYYTKRFDFKNPMNYKYFKNFLISSHAYDNFPSEIQIDFEVDNFNTKTPRIIYSNQSIFGTTLWGEKFNDKNVYKSNLIKLDYKGRNIKIKLKNDKLNQPMRIYDFNIIYLDRDVR